MRILVDRRGAQSFNCLIDGLPVADLDVLLRFGAVDPDDAEQGNALVARVVAMLSKMYR